MFTPIHTNNLKQIQASVLSLIKSQYNINETIFDWPKNSQPYRDLPELQNFFQELKIKNYVKGFAVNITNQLTSDIHVDHGDFRYSLNIPILNTENTFLKFYKPKYNITSTESVNDIPYYKYNLNDVTEIQKIETVIPGIVDTQTPHSFESHNNQARVMLLIRLKKDFTL